MKTRTIRFWIFGAVLFFGGARATKAQAQTTVTATVTDPNGIPYANGTVKAQINPPGPPSPCVVTGGNCVPIQGTVGPQPLDSTGSFTMNLYPNASISPAATTWIFTVCISPGVPLPQGTGPQCFSSSQTIAGASQSLSAQLSASATALTSTATTISPCTLNSIFVAGTSCYPTIQSAITAAGSAGSIQIPASYAGTDSYSNPSNVPVIDLRGGVALRIWSQIEPSRPISGYPLGNDFRIQSNGSADLYLAHDSNVSAVTTTAASLVIGVNTNILVGSTANFSATAGNVIVGRETTNEEVCTGMSIVDATHMSFTCGKTHTGTTDIEQLGSTIFHGGKLFIYQPENPSQLSGRSAPMRWADGALNIVMFYPGNTGNPWPFSGLAFAAKITGALNTVPLTPGDLDFQNSSSSKCARFLNSPGTSNIASMCDGGMSTSSLISSGTQSVSGCGLAVPLGGAWAGSFKSGTTGTCTVTITPGISAQNGFVCLAKDLTTPADEPKQTAYTTATCTLSWTTVTGDLITWQAIAF